jgi:hypothetical protein
LDVSESENVSFVMFVDVGWSEDLGRLLCEGEGALSIQWFGRMWIGVPVINQSIHWIMIPRMLFWIEPLVVVVVGLDVWLFVGG